MVRRKSARYSAQVGVETRRRGAIDHAVVPRQRQRQHQPRLELLAVPHRLHLALANAQDSDFRRVDDGREVAPADAAERRNGEARARHVGRAELAVARLLRQLAHFLADLQDALLVGVLDHRHHQAVGRVRREADVVVLLEHELLAVERGVELGEFLQRRHAGLDEEGQHRDLDARLLVFLVELDAEGFQLGDVGVVVVGDVRDHHPVAMQVGAADLLDARPGPCARRGRTWRSPPWARAAGPGLRRRRRRALSPPAALVLASPLITALVKACTSSWVMRPFGPVPFTSSSGTPSSRANLRTEGEACGSWPVGAPGLVRRQARRWAVRARLPGAGAWVAAGAGAPACSGSGRGGAAPCLRAPRSGRRR